MTKYYFIKRDTSDSSFHAQVTLEQLREMVWQNQASRDWLVTLNPYGESFNHFVRLPLSPAHWAPAGALVDGEYDESFARQLTPPGSLAQASSHWSFSGRASRTAYWVISAITMAALTAVLILAYLILAYFQPRFDQMSWQTGLVLLAMLSAYAVAIWLWLAVSVKRWHDRNKSGWMVLVVLLPTAAIALATLSGQPQDSPIVWGLSLLQLACSVWITVELGFLAGGKWDNQYGADPTF